MGIFERIDSSVLAVATRISHWFQRLTGRTNFFLAKIGFALGTLSLMIGLGNYWYEFLDHKETILAIFVFLPLTWLWFIMAKDCDAAEERALFGASRTKHPLSSRTGLRLMCLAFAILDVLEIPVHIRSKFWILEFLHEDYGIALVIYYYFVSVDPLPPGQSKVGAWLEALRASFLKPAPSQDRA